MDTVTSIVVRCERFCSVTEIAMRRLLAWCSVHVAPASARIKSVLSRAERNDVTRTSRAFLDAPTMARIGLFIHFEKRLIAC